MNSIDIDGQQDLVISHNRSAMTLDLSYENNVVAKVTNFNFIGLPQKTRIGRFISVIGIVWRFCK
jgi:hypothetical protein